MDRKELAKKIREAIFNRIEEDRAIHASSLDEEIEKVLVSAYVDAASRPLYSIAPARGASAPSPDMQAMVASFRKWNDKDLFQRMYSGGAEALSKLTEPDISWAPDPTTGSAAITVSEPPACTHTISSTGGILKKPDAWPPAPMQTYPAAGDIRVQDGQAYVYVGSSVPGLETWHRVGACTELPVATSPAIESALQEWGERFQANLAKNLFAQVEIITHPEAADK